MPGRNLIKEYVDESYYHIYNRGVDKALIYKDDQDFGVFLQLLKRYLSPEVDKALNRTNYPNYSNRVELLAFCLMNNHFHLFIYQRDAEAIKELMRSITTAYSMYFNKRYKRVGPVFQQRYRAVRVTDDVYLAHITRYIHLNPSDYSDYPWSSYAAYLGNYSADWLKPDRILELFDGDYKEFVEDYEEVKEELDELKRELADI